MLRIVCIFYLLSLANGLALLALDGMAPASDAPGRATREKPVIEFVPHTGLLERYSVLLVGAGVALMGMLQRWKSHW